VQKFKPLELAEKGKTCLKVPVPADKEYNFENKRNLKSVDHNYVQMSLPLDNHLMN